MKIFNILRFSQGLEATARLTCGQGIAFLHIASQGYGDGVLNPAPVEAEGLLAPYE